MKTVLVVALGLLLAHASAQARGVTSYGESIAPPKLSPLGVSVLDLVGSVARTKKLVEPALDARLSHVALLLAERLPATGRVSNDTVEAALRLFGVVEPSPRLIVARVSPGGDRELLESFSSQLPRALADGSFRRVGLAIFDAGERHNVVLVLGESFIELAPIARALPSGGPARIEGRLLAPYRKPSLLVTPPKGAVETIAITVEESRFRGTFHCGREKGAYQVEIIGEHRGGPTVLANFPIYCGMRAPIDLEVRASATATLSTDVAQIEAILLSLLNQDRARHRLPPLTIDAKVAEVARAHSRDMSSHNFVGHVSPSTGSAQDRARSAKLDAVVVRENVSRASTPEETEAGLMNSPGHRANILSTDVTHVGIGAVVTRDEAETVLWVTQLFIRRPTVLDAGEARGKLRDRIASLRRPLGLRPLAEDTALSRAADAAATALAKDPASQASASSTIERALGRERARFGTLRTVMVIAQELSQLDAHTSPALTDGRSAHLGLAAVPTRLSSGATALALCIILAEPR